MKFNNTKKADVDKINLLYSNIKTVYIQYISDGFNPDHISNYDKLSHITYNIVDTHSHSNYNKHTTHNSQHNHNNHNKHYKHYIHYNHASPRDRHTNIHNNQEYQNNQKNNSEYYGGYNSKIFDENISLNRKEFVKNIEQNTVKNTVKNTEKIKEINNLQKYLINLL